MIVTTVGTIGQDYYAWWKAVRRWEVMRRGDAALIIALPR